MTDPRPDVVVATVEGDTVDLVAWRVLGPGYRAAVPGILEANPGLAAHGAVLPAGTKVVVPATVTPDEAGERPVRLWD